MKVMNFLKYRNITNEKEESTKFTVKTLFKICAHRYRVTVLSSWYKNYLKRKKEKYDKDEKAKEIAAQN